MTTNSPQQTSYRNGRRRERTPMRAGVPHGVARTWHPNGQLAGEQRFKNGVPHGVCRQWDEDGRLLGEFEMKHGTGVRCEWHDNGQLKLELSMVEGQFCGPSRVWLRNGRLVSERFHLEGREVLPSRYARAAAKDQTLPQEPATKRDRRKKRAEFASAREIHTAFVEGLLAKPSLPEAASWLATAREPSLGLFKKHAAAVAFVQGLYDAGAVKVTVPGVYRDKRGGEYADWLLVELPASRVARSRIRRACGQIRTMRLGSFQPQRGMGESHIVISLE